MKTLFMIVGYGILIPATFGPIVGAILYAKLGSQTGPVLIAATPIILGAAVLIVISYMIFRLWLAVVHRLERK